MSTTGREFKSPILRKLMQITPKRIILFEKEDKIYSILLSISILIIGTIFCGLNDFYAFLLFFIDINQEDLDIPIKILFSFSFILNFLILFFIIEGIARLFYKKKENTLDFFISFAIILFPMILYLLIHLIFNFSDVLGINVYNFIDKIFMIVFQVISLWLLSYSLSIKKAIKIESSLIISLLLHYGGFTIILLILI